MKVYVNDRWIGDECDGYELEPRATASSYERDHLTVYEIPGKLFRRHRKLRASLEELEAEIARIVECQDEAQRYRESRPHTVFQLRQVRSGLVLIELTCPADTQPAYHFEPGREPEGLLQWYSRAANAGGETPFRAVGDVFSYTLSPEEVMRLVTRI